MAYNPGIHRRRSLRLKRYDYTHVGAYFVTIVTQGRLCLFGEIVGKEMRLNKAGEMMCGIWEALPQRFPTIEIDMFVVMPNHLHGIVVIKNRATTRVAPTNQNPDRGVENVPNAPNRTTTTVNHTKLTNVGAGLVPARNTNSTEHRAATRVAPTEIMDGGVDAPITDRFALGDVIGAYKSLTTVEYTRGVKKLKWAPFHRRLWQRNYYEHVVRHDKSLRQLQQYILDNPDQWAFDKENPLAERPETEKL
jgi:REP element-mobilizing transposase RayT